MAEGALYMSTKVALDVFTTLRHVFSIPSDTILTEDNLIKIYASGFTRIPVYEPGDKTAIIGILNTKTLIVVDQSHARPVSTLPLRIPLCVSPAMPLVHLLNLMQSGGKGGRGGHLALVCARPSNGEQALAKHLPVPQTAGLMGVVTLENVLEMLLQEQIYDEMDKRERGARQLALMVLRKWRGYVERKKDGTLVLAEPAMVSVVEKVMESGGTSESTSLLSASTEHLSYSTV